MSRDKNTAKKVDCLVNRIDHIEIACLDIKAMERLYSRLGFTTTQSREAGGTKQILMVQGQVRFLLTQGAPGTFTHTYAHAHGDGVCSLTYVSADPSQTLAKALERGAQKVAGLEKSEEKAGGGLRVAVESTAIKSIGDVRATFLARKAPGFDTFDVNAPFAPGFKTTGATVASGCGLLSIDHLTNNVTIGTMDQWVEFYKTIFGWEEVRFFNIHATKTGLVSKVMQSPDGGLKIPINEGTEEKSQVQEFVRRHKGDGVQHIAMATADIRATVKAMGDAGFKFLQTPASYYEMIPERARKNKIPAIKEAIPELQKLGILVDGDETGYLLQIFTEDQIGPLFFEIIQRKGNNGFGEGNFQALFDAIERDQEKRGVL